MISKIVAFAAICVVMALIGATVGLQIIKHRLPSQYYNGSLVYQGKAYIPYGLQGEGYTKDCKMPVYSVVLVPLEAKEKCVRESLNGKR